jgi:dihydroxyacetone kinase
MVVVGQFLFFPRVFAISSLKCPLVPRVGDDVSVPRSQGALTGRRGLAGTVLTYKIAGSLATKGASLDEVEYLAKLVSDNCGTMGMGLEHCHVPGTEKSEEYLKDNEAEIGMGIVSSLPLD